MKLLDKLKKWFTGGSSGSKNSGGSKKSTATEKIKSANRVTNYSGGGAQFETYGGGTARKAYQNAERSREQRRKEKEKKKKEQQKLRQIETAFKAQPSKQKTEAQKKEKETKSSTTSSVSKAFKATPPKAKAVDPKIQANAARKESSDIKKAIEKGQRESMAITLQPKVDKKYFSGTKEAKLRLKQGEYMNDPEVSKLEMAKHPVATSLARGGISGATFGLSELAAAKLPKSKGMQEAEDYYQRHKNKAAETAGELGTSLASFGLTSGASKAALGKLAPRAVEKLGASATERVAASGLVREAARKEALKKFGMTATEEQIKSLARTRASNIVKAVGEDMAINLTTGAVSDVSHALVDSDNPAEFVKNFLMNAGMNLGIGGVATVAPGLIRSTGIDDAVADAGRAAARKLDDVSGKVDLGGEKDDIFKAMDDIANGTEPKASAAGTETDDLLKEMDDIANGKAPETKAEKPKKTSKGKKTKAGAEAKAEEPKKASKGKKAKAETETKAKTEPEPLPGKEAWLKELDEKGETRLGRFGHIEKKKGGKYNLFVSGEGDRTLTKKEAEEYIDKAVKKLHADEESIRKTRTSPLTKQEKARIKEIDDEIAKLNAESKVDVEKSGAKAKYKDIEGYWDRQSERGSRITELTREKERIEIKEPEVKTEPTRKPTKNETLREQLREERKSLEQELETARKEGGDVDGILADMQETDMRIKDLDSKIAKVDKAREAKAKKAAQKAEAPEPKATAETKAKKGAKAKNEPKVDIEPKETKAKKTESKAKTTEAKAKAEPPEAKAETKAKKTKTKNNPPETKLARETVNKREVKPTLREKTTEVLDEVRTRVFNSLKAFDDEALKYKADPDRMQNMSGAVQGYRAADSVAGQTIFGDTQVNYAGNSIKDSKGLAEIFKPFGNPKNSKKVNQELERDFNYYMNLKHAPDRLREGKPIWETATTDDGRPLFDNDFVERLNVYRERAKELEQQIADAKTDKQRSKYEKALNKLNEEIERDTNESVAALKEVVDDEVKKILEAHPEFKDIETDVRKFLDNERQYTVDSGMISREDADKWAAMYPNYVPTHRDGFASMGSEIRGNTIGASGSKAATGSDRDLRSIRDQLEDMVRQNRRDASLNDMLKSTFEDRLSGEATDDVIEELETILANNFQIHKAKNGKYYAEILDEGKRQRIEIDKKFVDGLEDWAKGGKLGGALKVFDIGNDIISKPAEIWKRLITTDNPVFASTNFKRDLSEAGINSRNSKEFAECWPLAIKELSTNGAFAKAMMNDGVGQASIHNLDKALEKAAKGGGNGPLAKIEALNESIEMWPRLAEYMGTLKKAGIDVKNPEAILKVDKTLRLRAAANAADVTVNFGRSGSFGKFLNRGYVPFFNASAQGASKFARNFSEQPDAKAMLKLIGKLGALGIAPTVGCNLIYGEHGLDNKNYQNLSARDKATHWYVPITIGDTDASTTDFFVRIPKSRIGAAAAAPFVNAFNENKTDSADIVNITEDSVGIVSPSDNRFGKAFWDVVKTPEGKTWYGQPIVPKSLQGKNPYNQYDENTSVFGKAAGQASEKVATKAAKALGISEKEAKKKTLSPKKVDYIIDQMGGIVGDIALTTAPSKRGQKTPAPLQPLKEAWTLDATKRNNLSTRFYDAISDAETWADDTGKKEDKAEVDRMSAYSKEVSGINNAIKTLQGSNRANKQEDIKELRRYSNQLMMDALDGKAAPSKQKTMDTVQKYVGTSYAVKNFGSSADREAYDMYSRLTYGNLKSSERAKKMDADKDFYKGVKAIGNLKGKIEKKTGKSGITKVGQAVALAEAGVNDNLFGAYKLTGQSRNERSNEMNRAKAYIKNGGSAKEYVKIENARKTLGKLPDETQTSEIKKLKKQLGNGEITAAEYEAKEKEIKANANISYKGLATSLALANAPKRAYELLDIKDENVQKGINLGAIGFDARGYREAMKKADKDQNGYPKKDEIIDYINKSGVEDKATLYAALYPYKTTRNPFGTPTNYSRREAALEGKRRKVEWIVKDLEDIEVNPEESGSGYRRYGRRWRRWRRRGYGGGGGGSSATPKLKQSAFKAKAMPTPKKGPTSKVKVTAPKTKKLNIKTVKGAKTQNMESMLDAALRDIQSTQKKVAPPKAKRK